MVKWLCLHCNVHILYYLDGCVKILYLGRFFYFIFVIMRYSFLGTKSLMQREL